MTHVTCRLTAKNRGQLQNPTLGNRVWATFTFFCRVNESHCNLIIFSCDVNGRLADSAPRHRPRPADPPTLRLPATGISTGSIIASEQISVCSPLFACAEKKLRYRRGTARRAVAVDVVSTAALLYRNTLYNKSATNRSSLLEL